MFLLSDDVVLYVLIQSNTVIMSVAGGLILDWLPTERNISDIISRIKSDAEV